MQARLSTTLLLLAAACAVPVAAQTTIPMLAGGGGFSLALLPNGSVQAWGGNGSGQLGTGTFPYPSSTPLQIPSSNLNGVVAIAAGGFHALALLANGTVKAWGDHSYGQLGLGNASNASTPQQIPSTSLSNVAAIAVGGAHNLALLSNGTVMAWGDNSVGQLGLGNASNQSTPQQVPASSLSSVVSVAAGFGHSLALLSNGTVKSWGVNQHGELGLGTTTNHSTPQQIPAPSLSSVVAIAAGGAHCFALHANGRVTAWGMNSFGQLGLGNTIDQLYPQGVSGASLSNVMAVKAASFHSVAVLSDGTVKTWGDNYYGQLGIGFTPYPSFHSTPQQVPGLSLSNVNALAVGGNHSFALLSSGAVKGWGWNVDSLLGLGTPVGVAVATPQAVYGMCLSGATTYALQFGPLGNSALGITIPCNPLTGALIGPLYYFNTFSVDSLNATSPGTGAWQGLHTTQAEVLTWLNLGMSGFTLALGPLGATGGAAQSVAISPATLSGLTVYGVSVAFHPVTLAVVANSAVTSHSF